MALKKRQKDILRALTELGGEATTRQIAEKTDLHVNGVAQSLGALHEHVKCLGGRAGDTRWKLTQSSRMKAKLVLHHDDPPCAAKLTTRNGGRWCAKCKLHPDMQSTCLWFYCPSCNIPLKEMQCQKCERVFRGGYYTEA